MVKKKQSMLEFIREHLWQILVFGVGWWGLFLQQNFQVKANTKAITDQEIEVKIIRESQIRTEEAIKWIVGDRGGNYEQISGEVDSSH